MDEQEERLGMIWEDPREAPRTGATVIRKSSGPLDLGVFPHLLMEHLGMLKPDAVRTVRGEGGILVDNVDPGEAERLAAALRANGEDCLVVPAAEVIDVPRPQPIHSVKLTNADMGPVNAAGRQEAAPWEYARVLVLGHVEVERSQTKSTDTNPLSRRMPYARTLGVAGGVVARALDGGGARSKTTKTSSTRTFLEVVFDEPIRRYRVDSRAFDYSVLGDQLQPNSEENVQNFARWLLHCAPRMRVNVDREKLMATGKVAIDSCSAHGFDDVVRWIVNLSAFEQRQ